MIDRTAGRRGVMPLASRLIILAGSATGHRAQRSRSLKPKDRSAGCFLARGKPRLQTCVHGYCELASILRRRTTNVIQGRIETADWKPLKIEKSCLDRNLPAGIGQARAVD
jgi:hypothetical protein